MTREPPLDVWIYSAPEQVVRKASLASPDRLIVAVSGGTAVARNGIVVRLNSTPRYIILAVAAARGGIVSTEQLLDLIFGDRDDGGPVSLSSYIADARTAAVSLGLCFKTHHGRGFSLHRVVEAA